MSRPNKLYASQAWLRRKYLIDRLSPEEIAKICGCEPMTIYRYIKKYGFKR